MLLLPQFVGVLQQAEIIAGHEFVTHEGKKKALFDAVVQHTRHLNDYPIQNVAHRAGAPIGFVILLVRRIWWPLAMWLLLVVSIVHSSAPFGGPIGTVTGMFSDLFYSDPRRLSAVVTMLLAPDGGHRAVHARPRPRWPGCAGSSPRLDTRVGHAVTAVVLVAVTVGLAWHYFPRHRHLIGEKYDQVMIDDKDLEAFAYLATLPGARDTLIGNANTDGTAWMYAVAGLHPLWTHYDYPQQQGPGYHRFIFWAYADDADTDPRVAEAVHALEHPLRHHQHTGGTRVRHARRTSVARQVEVVEEDLRQRRGPHLRVAGTLDPRECQTLTSNADDERHRDHRRRLRDRATTPTASR